jgi:hypothetical protein
VTDTRQRKLSWQYVSTLHNIERWQGVVDNPLSPAEGDSHGDTVAYVTCDHIKDKWYWEVRVSSNVNPNTYEPVTTMKEATEKAEAEYNRLCSTQSQPTNKHKRTWLSW